VNTNPSAEDNANDSVNWDWEKMSKDVFSEDKRPIILFDGICNLCNGGVNFAIDQDESAKFRFCSLQSKVAESLLIRSGKSHTDKSNIVLITEDEAYISSDAVSRICMELDTVPLQWFGVLGQFTPVWVRESIFQFVSDNRYKFGETDSCRLDFDGDYTSRFLSDPECETDDALENANGA
jgi:predicted DCC family thiol-disulfide oxidoreductase YuxK